MRASCHAGCACKARAFDAHNARGSSVTAIGKLQVKFTEPQAGAAASAFGARRCPCTVRLTLLNASSGAGGGHKFKVTAVFSGVRAYMDSWKVRPD